MDQINVLKEEAARVRRRRERLQEEREELEENRRRVTDRLEGLEHLVLSSLKEDQMGGSSLQVFKRLSLCASPFVALSCLPTVLQFFLLLFTS